MTREPTEKDGNLTVADGDGLVQIDGMVVSERTFQLIVRIIEEAPVVSFRKDEDEPGFMILELEEDAARELGIYHILWMDPRGRVAEAMVNHPRYFDTFMELVNA